MVSGLKDRWGDTVGAEGWTGENKLQVTDLQILQDRYNHDSIAVETQGNILYSYIHVQEERMVAARPLPDSWYYETGWRGKSTPSRTVPGRGEY